INWGLVTKARAIPTRCCCPPLNSSGLRPLVGQQQRVGIARALVTNPQLMLWDEPTASLDPILVGEVLEVMEELVKTTGTTMVIVTHEVSFALRVADRVVFMDRGRIVEEGAPREVLEEPRSEIARLYRKLLVS
ncbi:MAG TPA: amino acid ABC transporter ATP-binding protein, partial [Firmicutes bacterium]|nr:amino acid ABC transporter ATP-binding protein [Bacillota bacterium]